MLCRETVQGRLDADEPVEQGVQLHGTRQERQQEGVWGGEMNKTIGEES